MEEDLFNGFRLVGGTGLSLQLGHRESDDIDLFTDAEYGSVDFDAIELYLAEHFSYLDSFDSGAVGFGKSYFIGVSKENSIKLDVCYTDPFIRPILFRDGIRIAQIEEIIALKIEVIRDVGRKKDFWDIHELLDDYSIQDMLKLHQARYPYIHNKKEILANLRNFETADADFDPRCLRGKYWEIIKLDILDALV